MGAKEDLITKLNQRANAERLKDRLLAEQNALFVTRLPDLFRSLENAVDGVPGVVVSKQDIGSGMDKHFSSLVIDFLGATIRFDPFIQYGEYGVRARNLSGPDLFFVPTESGGWSAEFMPDEIFTLDEDLLIKRLSKLVDEEQKERVNLWD